MGFVHLTRHMRAMPHDVFSLATDVPLLPSWLAVIEEVQSGPARLDQVDATMTALMKLGPRHLVVDWTVTKFEADQLLHLHGTSEQGGDADVQFEMALWDGETEFSMDLEYELPGGFVTSLADGLWIERSIAHDLRRSLRTLAHEVEILGPAS